ncbi:hypothetical protein L7F22_055826 [Adiantum nelumboides]|nr:hypothetical protein [Adiantum nelumboides]
MLKTLLPRLKCECIPKEKISMLVVDIEAMQLELAALAKLRTYLPSKIEDHAQPLQTLCESNVLIRKMLLHHVDSPCGSFVVRCLNVLHSYYHIWNDKYLYLISLYVLDIIVFFAKWFVSDSLQCRYGYTNWTNLEKISHYRVSHDIVVCMGICNIPTILAAFA